MPLEARLLTGLAIAVAVVYWSTPLAIRVADRFHFYDKPFGYKGHSSPTPYLGGAALITGFVAAVMLLASDWQRTVPVVSGVVALWVVGTIDDRRTVAWWLRVLVELALSTLLWATDLGWDLGLGPGIDLALTAIWVIAVVNAFNLFDNMDGQSTTMGLVTSIGLAALGVAYGDTWVAVAGAAMAGACFGFLPHNLLSQPARIFLGDGGSMPLGFTIASVAMIGASSAVGEWQAVALGLLLVGVPALDTALVVVSRRRRGISLLTGGRDHLTHRARQRLRTAFAVALALGSAQIVLSLMAVAAARGSTLMLGATAMVYLVALAVAIAVIDTRIPAVPAETPAPAAPSAVPAAPTRFAAIPREGVPLAVLGAGAGISPWFGGYYSASVWVPIGLGLIVCLIAVGIARPPRPGMPAWLALGGLVGLGLWGLTSALWADSIEQAVVDANRSLALGAALGLSILLIRDRRTALWGLGAFLAGALVVEIVQIIDLLGPHATGRFLGGRLNEPLGYINAMGTFSILLMWPLVALAEQKRSALLAGAAFFFATVSAGLVVLSQSRGAALAVIGSIVIVLALVPGRRRRAGLLLLLGAAVVAVGPALVDVSQHLAVAHYVHRGVTALLLSALVCAIVWTALVSVEQRLDDGSRVAARRAVSFGLAALAILALAVGVVKHTRISNEVHDQWHAFVHLSAEQGGENSSSRLLSGAGNRYDYWRVAVDAWKDHPLLGVGSGNYDEPYFEHRATTEDIRQPHSMALQSLAELGLPGLLLTLLFFGAVTWAAVRRGSVAGKDRTERGLLVAALGIFWAFGIHTQVDWIHLLPGVTAAALIAAAVLLRPLVRPNADGRLRRPAPRAVAAAALMLPVAITGISLSRQVLAQHYRGEAQAAVAAGDPARAIREANRALRLDGEDLQTQYAKAAAYARLGNANAADAILRHAIALEPGDFLPYALLGDLSVRRRQYAKASYYYRQSAVRNPRDTALSALAQNPRSAQQQP